ncbi:MAG: bifunctional folylpolyglutamate synthase/dihydrofolate synthase [Dissulfurispiraceae bacterium]
MINYLYGLQKHGIKLGLDNVKTLLAHFDNPQENFSTIHVAGTNGKGSVSAMIASILAAMGFKVGLFTSPHLVSFTERIRINNQQITEPEVVALIDEIRSAIQSQNALFSAMKPQIPNPTFFEVVTAATFLYFFRKGVDWAVIEVGMGGRLDATNVISPKASVITRISHDHREFLGHDLADIAKEKAGIIKEGIPVVCASQEQEAEKVIRSTALEKSSDLSIYGKDFTGVLKSSELRGITFDYANGVDIFRNLFTPLAGEHQLSNACVAIKATGVATEKGRMAKRQKSELHVKGTMSAEAVRNGLATTSWQGRLEIISTNPFIIIDGAHNPDAAVALSEFVKKYLLNYKIILIVGIMSDKDISGLLRPLLSVASETIFTAPNYSRSSPPQKLFEYASALGYTNIHSASTIKCAIKQALDIYSSLIPHHSPLILITGSFYTIGEAKEFFGEKAILGSLRETL